MKSILPSFFGAIARYVAEVAASESGELLSVRRKCHLLEAQRYVRLDTEASQAARARVVQAARASQRSRSMPATGKTLASSA